MKIVCYGEALVDFKATGPLTFQGFVGGSPLNVALAAARLGTPVALAAQVSRDLFGEAIVAHLEANGVDRSLVVRDDAPSTLAFVAEAGGDVDFTFVGDVHTRYDPQPRPELPGELAFLEFSSVALLHEPAAATILEMIAAHRERCTVIFDPNVRPALIADRAGYVARLATALSLSHLVKVSSQDLRWLYPDTEPLAAAERWLQGSSQASGSQASSSQGSPEAIILTQGGDSTVLVRSQGLLEVPIPQVDIVDTVGAGDTFMGALMVRLIEQGHTAGFAALPDAVWRGALAFAAAAAALNCTRPGADPPTRAELRSFYPQAAE